MIKFTHQHPENLILGVLRHEVAIPMKILLQRTVTFDTWAFDFAIIGESHRVRIEHEGKLVLQEVFACVSLPSCDCWHYHSCQRLENHAFETPFYAVNLDFEHDTETPIPQSDNALTLNFPSGDDRIPVTHMRWQQKRECVYWWTLHTYPESGKFLSVHTKSRFDLIRSI